MILKTIPKSLRAGVALFVVFVCFYGGLQAFQQLLLPGDDSFWVVAKCVGGLIIGVIAIVFFYYFQSVDGSGSKYSEIDTLSKYHQTEREKQKLSNVEITHAYDFDKESSDQEEKTDQKSQ